MIINGKTKTVALLGDPVDHSFSPFIHNYGFKSSDLNMVYVNHNVKKHDLKDAIKGIKALGYIGANITYPHKTEVLNYLDEISEEASLIGAVNTIKNQDGKLIGYNTDGLGFIYGLVQNGIEINNKTICVLGAGGAARSIIIALCLEYSCNIIVCNRSIMKAKQIDHTINTNAAFVGKVISVVEPENLTLDNVDILINATPIGMGEFKDMIPFEDRLNFSKNIILCDLIYNPLETRLLRKAKEQGCTTYNGLNMLVGQAILAFKIWTGETLNFDKILYEVIKKI